MKEFIKVWWHCVWLIYSENHCLYSIHSEGGSKTKLECLCGYDGIKK